MRSATARTTASTRRGLTLVEMMVVVALVVLMMTVLVLIFQAATGAVSEVRAYQDLDANLRRIDTQIRQDLAGVTARMTPPLNPNDNLGYFEYGENAYADLQGEDTDDYIAFTAKAPEGRPFVGRVWIPDSNPFIQPIMITSQYAEIIYFLRNGNLYRRVFLIAPERQSSVALASPGAPGPGQFESPSMFGPGMFWSWLGMNDLSARPSQRPGPLDPTNPDAFPILNTLGDLTNRENRAFRPRWANNYTNVELGFPDDSNGNGIPDHYQTLYFGVHGHNEGFGPLVDATLHPAPASANEDTMAFPYIFTGSYTRTGNTTFDNQGWIDTFDPANHAPLDVGDNLPVPAPTQHYTWWGFLTWKETMSPNWHDPVHRLNVEGGQAPGLSRTNFVPLPPVETQPFNDGAGGPTFLTPDFVWHDDLILTGVRSFDVKAYDPNARIYDGAAPAYYDLGYGSLFVPALLTSTPSLFLNGLGHEGRMPPLTDDLRADAQWPLLSPNIGDNRPTILRLRRVWDSWSTDYTNAPALPNNPILGPPFNRPAYPSYPPPYPAPLRGLQIQIRVVDPTNELIKVLTIRHDFSGNL